MRCLYCHTGFFTNVTLNVFPWTLQDVTPPTPHRPLMSISPLMDEQDASLAIENPAPHVNLGGGVSRDPGKLGVVFHSILSHRQLRHNVVSDVTNLVKTPNVEVVSAIRQTRFRQGRKLHRNRT